MLSKAAKRNNLTDAAMSQARAGPDSQQHTSARPEPTRHLRARPRFDEQRALLTVEAVPISNRRATAGRAFTWTATPPQTYHSSHHESSPATDQLRNRRHRDQYTMAHPTSSDQPQKDSTGHRVAIAKPGNFLAFYIAAVTKHLYYHTKFLESH